MIGPLRSCLATNTESNRDCDPDSDADTDSGSSTAVFCTWVRTVRMSYCSGVSRLQSNAVPRLLGYRHRQPEWFPLVMRSLFDPFRVDPCGRPAIPVVGTPGFSMRPFQGRP